MADLAAGSVFAGHRIEGLAGRGGMGVVYRATHLALDHPVALKVISAALAGDERFRRRFADESRIAVSLQHPNVVQIHHAGEEQGLLFVTMDLIEGTDLRGLLVREGPLGSRRAVAIVEQVAAALDVAHARGLVHRDIKPGNVLIEDRPEGEHVYLTDFGLARQVEASTGVTATGAFVGTLDYVAPEQIRGERVDARADVYALGCVLFEALTGNPPFAAREDKVAKMYAHLQEESPRLRVLRPELPGELDLVVARALAKDPAERFPSAGDLARAARAAIEGEPTVEAERSVATGAAAPASADATVAASTVEERGRREDPAGREEAGPSTIAAEPPALTPTVRGRPGAPALIGLGALAAVAAVVALLLVGGDGGDDEGGEPAPPGRASREAGGKADDGRARVVDEVADVGGLPVELAHGEGGVWVTSRNGGRLTFIDARPDDAEIANRFQVGPGAEGVAVVSGAVWVAVGDRGELVKVDPASGEIDRRVSGFTKPQGVTFGQGSIWVSDYGADELVRVDPVRARIVDRLPAGDGPYGIALDDERAWVSARLSGALVGIPLDGGDGSSTPLGFRPKGVAVAGGDVWVAATGQGTLKRVRDGVLEDSIAVGSEPRGVAAGFGSVWVSCADGEVTRIDAQTGEVEDRLPLEPGLEGIVAGPDSVWVANGVTGTVARIDPGA